MRNRLSGFGLQALALALVAVASESCKEAPHQRELGAQQIDPVELARRTFRDMSDKSPPEVQERTEKEAPLSAPDQGPIRKESLGADPGLSRGFEEEPETGSRRNFIDMYSKLLEEKHSLELSLQALRKRVASLEGDLQARTQKEEQATRELEELKASQKLLEDALVAAQDKAEKNYDLYVAAEEKRLQNEIQVVRLQHELVRNGIKIPVDLASATNEGK